MENQIIFWTQLSLDVLFEGLAQLPQLGHEQRGQNVDLQLGGGVTTYATVLTRFGVETELHYFSNKNSNLSKFAKSILETYNIRSLVDHQVDFNPVDVTAVLSTTKDRALASYLDEQTNEIDPKFWCSLMKESKYVFLNHQIVEGLTTADVANKTCFFAVGYNEVQNIPMVMKALELTNYLVLNEIEAELLFDEPNLTLCLDKLEQYLEIPIISIGEKGCLTKIDNEYYRFYLPGKCDFIDATGAGDNFMAGLIYGVISELSPFQVLKFAIACGTLSIQGLGAYGNQYTLSQVKQLALQVQVESLAGKSMC